MLILSPTANNEFRAGYNRRDRRETAFTQGEDWAKQLGIPNVSGATFPYFNIGYGLSGLPSFQNIGEDFTIQDNFTKMLRQAYLESRLRADPHALQRDRGRAARRHL